MRIGKMEAKIGVSELAKRVATSLAFTIIFFGSYVFVPVVFELILVCILLYIIVIEWPRLISPKRKLFWILLPLYPVLPAGVLWFLCWLFRQGHLHPLAALYPYLVAWIADSCAYATGSLWGKHKICPTISPGKSWEGLCGAFVGVLGFNMLMLKFFKLDLYVTTGVVVILVALSFSWTLLGFFGDIFVSYLKRRAFLKDTGALLPGHGVLLDRFDSVFFIAPVYWFLIFIF